MSVKAMSRVWDLQLTPDERIVLLAMADHADQEGNHIYPSIALIAWKTGYSERSVQRIIKKLREQGILVLAKQSTLHSPNVYRMDLKAGIEKQPFEEWKHNKKQGCQDVTPENRGAKMSPGDTCVVSRGDIAMSPKPSDNHHEEVVECATRTRRHSSKKQDDATPLVIREAMADVCKIDLNLGSRAQKLELNSACRDLWTAAQEKQVSAEGLADRIRYAGNTYWYAHDWRGKKQEAPRPTHIREVWRAAMEARAAKSNGTHTGNFGPLEKLRREREEVERERAMLQQQQGGTQ